jgi:medium-chain acyl-[acyl-carrier-protein] hydrolase
MGGTSLIEDEANWFFTLQSQRNARMRLFCVPYAGGWPWVFRPWAVALAPDIEVCSIYLPGRGRRSKESMPVSVRELARSLSAAVSRKTDLPYAIFGHSFGALLAFELAAELEASAVRPPARVFVSGCSPFAVNDSFRLHELSDEQLLGVVRGWGSSADSLIEKPEVLALTLAMLRMDLKVSDGHVPQSVLDCPLTAFFGSADAQAGSEEAAAWHAHTRGGFAAHELPGGHFFIHDQSVALMAAVQRQLQEEPRWTSALPLALELTTEQGRLICS